jgi:ribosomal protein S18 acetylase RimI-like enzyme
MTFPTLYVRPARGEDIDTILRWRRETAAWLSEKYGTDQWSTPFLRSRLERWADRGDTFMASLEPGGAPVATITSSAEPDPDLWTPEECAKPARYVFKANVVRDQAGRGIGECLIKWTLTKAAEAGVDSVRIDVWSTNENLQDFYRHLGFEYLRTIPGTNSGALFEAQAIVVPGLPIVETDQNGTATVA